MKLLNSKYSALIFILILAVVIFTYCWKEDQILIKNHVLSIGKIVGGVYGGKGHTNVISLNYIFYLTRDEKFEGQVEFSSDVVSFRDAKSFFIGRTFPVVYNPNDPSNNSILINENACKKYNVPFPDSLEWTKKYFKQ